jgi:hypothetical protein
MTLRWRLRSSIAVIAILALIFGGFSYLRSERRRESARRGLKVIAIQKLAAAKTREEAFYAFFENSTVTGEQYARESIRLMEAERDAAGEERIPIAALIGHRDRMRRMMAFLERGDEIHPGTSKTFGQDYFLLEAEFWLAKAKAEQ